MQTRNSQLVGALSRVLEKQAALTFIQGIRQLGRDVDQFAGGGTIVRASQDGRQECDDEQDEQRDFHRVHGVLCRKMSSVIIGYAA